MSLLGALTERRRGRRHDVTVVAVPDMARSGIAPKFRTGSAASAR